MKSVSAGRTEPLAKVTVKTLKRRMRAIGRVRAEPRRGRPIGLGADRKAMRTLRSLKEDLAGRAVRPAATREPRTARESRAVALSREGDPELAAKVAYLADPHHFGGHVRAVEVIETHFAWVFLAGSRALKLKKPVHQASMDYRTLAARERACRAELALNRRLAPGAYLRVVALWRTREGALSRRAGVRIVDWLIEMRKLPAARRLDALLARGALDGRDRHRLLVRLGTFFSGATRRPMSDRAYRARLRRQIVSSARELGAPDLGLAPGRVARLERSQLEFLVRHARMLAGRGARLVDGHGDLRPEHVFLGEWPRVWVIDCLEFDPDLRRLDPAEEIAFLALECARLGGARVAADLLAEYRCVTGDPAPQALTDFYMSRRAAVRAQLAAWHLRDKAFVGQRRIWRARAHSYLRDALRLSRRAAGLAYVASLTAFRTRGEASGVIAKASPARRSSSSAPSHRGAARSAT